MLRLVRSEDRVTEDAKERVYPPSIICWHCGVRFYGDEAKSVFENDGVCTPCAEYLDTFSKQSEQGHKERT